MAYRVPAGVLTGRIEFHLDGPGRAVPLNRYEGDWYPVKCGAVAVAPGGREVSYVVSITAPVHFEGTYLPGQEQARGGGSAGGAALLRARLHSLYGGQEGFPRGQRVDLLDWARAGSGCRGPLAEVFGPQPSD